jgi:hypothetical protein
MWIKLRVNWKRQTANTRSTLAFLLCFVLCSSPLSAEEKLYLYFSNDSMNGFKFSDAYETHNMGLVYGTDDYYLKFDLGIVSPDMYVYRNEYRAANRSFGELISLEIGKPHNGNQDFRFYARTKATGEFGVDKLQDFAHRLLKLQPVNSVNNLIRMPEDVWFGVGLRSEFEPSLSALKGIIFKVDGFVGSDTAFLNIKFTKQFKSPLLTYDVSLGSRFIAYDQVVSAPPINAKERSIIPEASFGISYDNGPYSIFLRDVFSLPSIRADNSLFGVFSAGVSYAF